MSALKTLHFITRFSNLDTKEPPALKTINLSNLYKMLSICIGKPVFHKPKPISLDIKLKNFFQVFNYAHLQI